MKVVNTYQDSTYTVAVVAAKIALTGMGNLGNEFLRRKMPATIGASFETE